MERVREKESGGEAAKREESNCEDRRGLKCLFVICVYKTGGEYDWSHVEKLFDMVRRHLTIEHRFLCFTDSTISLHLFHKGVNDCKLRDDLPGWWSKIEMFRFPGPCLYFDLDTIIRGNIDDLVHVVQDLEFVALRDFYRGRQNRLALQSSVMYWSGDMSGLYTKFMSSYPSRVMSMFRGDQNWIEWRTIRLVRFFQDLTDCFASYKVDHGKLSDPNKRVIVFHGDPRPWQQTEIPYV